MAKCPNCQAAVPDGSRFCVQCGATAGSAPPPPEATLAVPPDATILADQPEAPPSTPPPPPVDTPSATPPPIDEPPAAAPEATAPTPSTGTGSKYDISKLFETSGVCPNCYAPLDKQARRCAECGHVTTAAEAAGETATVIKGQGETPEGTRVVSPPPVPAPPPPPGPAAPAKPSAPPPPPPVARPTRKRGLLIPLLVGGGLILLLVLAAGGVAVWWWYFRDGPVPLTPPVTAERPVTETGSGEALAGGGEGEDPDQLREQALAASRAENWDDAADLWTRYRGLRSGDPSALLQLARVEGARGNLSQAQQHLAAYLSERPTDAAARALSGELYARQGRDDDAIQAYLTARAQDPAEADHSVQLGKLYARTGFADKAIDAFREAVRLDPGHEEAMWQLARQLEKAGNREEAGRVARRYADTFPAGRYRSEAEMLLAMSGPEPTPDRPRPGSTPTAGSEPAARRDEAPPPVRPAARPDPTPPSRPDSRPETRPDPRPTRPEPDPPAPQPSRYVTVQLDATALSLPNLLTEVTISLAGIQRTFRGQVRMDLDNVERGRHQYTVTVVYYSLSNNERERTYTGGGTLNVQYPNQRLFVKRYGDVVRVE